MVVLPVGNDWWLMAELGCFREFEEGISPHTYRVPRVLWCSLSLLPLEFESHKKYPRPGWMGLEKLEEWEVSLPMEGVALDGIQGPFQPKPFWDSGMSSIRAPQSGRSKGKGNNILIFNI